MLGKHLYGGLGQNPVNPAMLGYVLMLISAPITMTTLWVDPLATPDLATAWLAYLDRMMPSREQPCSTFTEPNSVYSQREASQNPLFTQAHLGLIYGYEWVALAYLVGGLWLIYQRVITWHTPVGLLVTLAVVCAFLILIHSATPVWIHLTTQEPEFSLHSYSDRPSLWRDKSKGRLWFAIGVGIVTYLIRTYGLYPDASAFAGLLMNFAVPMIDHYTRPRIMGRSSSIRGSGGQSLSTV